MDKTSCHTYFTIGSSGVIENEIGFVANENSDFDPEYITEKLQIEPFETRKMGSLRKDGHGVYPFSGWTACYQDEPAIDAEEQCLKIVRALKDKIPLLLEIKKEIDVSFNINIVPHIYYEENPVICFNNEIIEFCYLTGTKIGVDLYVYDSSINDKVDKLFENLSCTSDEFTQKWAIEDSKALNKKYLPLLIRYKDVDAGENCAKALSELPDETLRPFLPYLLEWLQDMNWPGAWTILERLKKFNDAETLARVVEKSVKVALACDDQHWLKSMSGLLGNDMFAAELNKETKNILYDRYHWHDNE